MYKSHRAYKSSTLSQNFIKSKDIARKIVGSAHLAQNDLVIEIGPGKGALTEFILNDCRKLVAVEIDSSLCRILQTKFSSQNNFELINMDFLNFKLPTESFKLVSNIPFHITTAILTKILSSEYLTSATLIIQKEAACMFGGNQLNSFETLKSLQMYPFYEFKIEGKFQRTDFLPKSKVDTVLLVINKRDPPLINQGFSGEYFKFIREISKVKVGEGVWKKLFTKKQLIRMQREIGLKLNKGIASQSPAAIMKAFLISKVIQ